MPLKVTWSFRWDDTGRKGYGASESHYLLLDPADLAVPMAADVHTLTTKRVEMLAGNVVCSQVRISRVFQRGPKFVGKRKTLTAFTSVEPTLNRFGLPSGTTTFDTLSADWPDTCLQLELATAASESAKGRNFLLGLPDALFGTDPPGPKLGDVAGWVDKYEAWAAQLSGGVWAFKARTEVADPFPADILGWANEEGGTGRLTLSVPDPEDPGDVRDVIQIRGVIMLNPLFQRPNGQYRIAAKSSVGGVTTITLRSTEGLDASQIDEPGTVEPVEYQLYPISDSEIAGETSRKRGVGSVRPRGRSRTRTRRLA